MILKVERYSARVICDCLPKETTKAYEKHLGIDQNVAEIEAKENEPPIKRLKVSTEASFPSFHPGYFASYKQGIEMMLFEDRSRSIVIHIFANY